jgi:multidrug transporter EmrE-like cation transporter
MVCVAALLEGVAQVALKCAAGSSGTRHVVWLSLGGALFAVEIGLYTRALKTLDIAVAYPLSALSYAAVVLAARVLLGERPDRSRWTGVVLIVAGAACALPDA